MKIIRKSYVACFGLGITFASVFSGGVSTAAVLPANSTGQLGGLSLSNGHVHFDTTNGLFWVDGILQNSLSNRRQFLIPANVAGTDLPSSYLTSFDFSYFSISPTVNVTASGILPLVILSSADMNFGGHLSINGGHGSNGLNGFGSGGGAGGGAVALFAEGKVDFTGIISLIGGSPGVNDYSGFGITGYSGSGGVGALGGANGGDGGDTMLGGQGGDGGEGFGFAVPNNWSNIPVKSGGGGGGGGGAYAGAQGGAGAVGGRAGLPAPDREAACKQPADGGAGGDGGMIGLAKGGAAGKDGMHAKIGGGGGGGGGSAPNGGPGGRGGNGGTNGGGAGGGGGGGDRCDNKDSDKPLKNGGNGGGGGGGGKNGGQGTPGSDISQRGGPGGGGALMIGSGSDEIFYNGNVSLLGGGLSIDPGLSGGLGSLSFISEDPVDFGPNSLVNGQFPTTASDGIEFLSSMPTSDFLFAGGGGGGGGGTDGICYKCVEEVPGPLPIMGVISAFLYARRLRRLLSPTRFVRDNKKSSA
jgi:hypothetical protein